MKRTLLQSLLAVALLLVCGNVWATDASVNFSGQGYTNQQSITSATVDANVSVTFDKGTNNSNVPKYYSTGAAVRCYGGNTFTVSAATGNITSITLTFGSGDGTNAITANGGSFTSPTWTGSASSVTFTIGGTTGNRRIAGISVTYTAGGSTQVATPAISPASCSFLNSQEVTISCATEGAAITYTTDDWATSSTYTASFTVTETTTVQAKATKSGMDDSSEASATYTKVAPLTTMDAIFEAAATPGDYYVTLNNYVVSGVKNNNAYVTDGTKGFLVYKSGHNLYVGDVLSGTCKLHLTKYQGSAEFTDLTSTTEGLTVTPGGTLTPQAVNIADLSGINTGALITVNNVKYNGAEFEDESGNSIKPFNTFMIFPELVTGQTYNVTGMYLQYNDVKEICPKTDDDFEKVVEDSYSITIDPNIENGTVTTTPADEAAEGVEVVLTITPAAHFELADIEVIGVDSGDPVTVTDGKFTMPNEDVTITATFTEQDKYLVHFYVYGTESANDYFYEDQPIVSPYDPTDVAFKGWTFCGWTEDADYQLSTTAPALVDLKAPVTKDMKLYAVFSAAAAGGESGWVETDLDKLTATDVFVIVGNEAYAMSNDNGTSKAPDAVEVFIENGKITSEVADKLKWNISGNATDGYVFYPNGDDEKWLYCTNSNNGVRVGTNENSCFTVSEEGYLFNTGQSRYVGIYNSQDWRCYTSIINNIKEQTFAFYKLASGTIYYTTDVPPTQDVTISAACYATACVPFDAVISGTDVKAYYVTTNGNTLALDEMTDEVIPAATGLLLEGTGTVTFTMSAADNTDKEYAATNNQLVGTTDEGGHLFTGDDATYFILSKVGGAVGFYWDNTTADEGASANCAQYKAVLKVPAAATTTGQGFRIGGTTHIDQLLQNDEDAAIYDLMGRRVSNASRGIYIKSGKKVVIR